MKLKFNFFCHSYLFVTQSVAYCIQSDQKENKSEQVLHVVAEFYANKRSMHGGRQFVISNGTL
jgi:hypothetical protein